MDFCRSLSDQKLRREVEVDFTEESSLKGDISNIYYVDKVNILLHTYLSLVLLSWNRIGLQHTSGLVV